MNVARHLTHVPVCSREGLGAGLEPGKAGIVALYQGTALAVLMGGENSMAFSPCIVHTAAEADNG